MPKCQRCPIKKECKTVGLYVKNNKGEKKALCPFLFLINKYIVEVIQKTKEKENKTQEGGTFVA